MLSKLKKFTIVSMATAALTVALPAAHAYAINGVSCTDPGFLEFWVHDGLGSRTLCFANSGTSEINNPEAAWNVWTDKISTGNNDLMYHDCNGSDHIILRWNIVNFPNRPVCIQQFRIN